MQGLEYSKQSIMVCYRFFGAVAVEVWNTMSGKTYPLNDHGCHFVEPRCVSMNTSLWINLWEMDPMESPSMVSGGQ